MSAARSINLRLKFIGVSAVVIVGVLGIGLMNWLSLSRLSGESQQSRQASRLVTQAVETARRSQVHFKKQVQCWKDTLIRGNDAAAFDKYFHEFENEEGATQHDLQALRVVVE